MATGTASSFTARMSLTLRTDALEHFRDELRTLDAKRTGVAELTHLEDEMELTVRLKRGKGTLTGFVLDHDGPELRFEHIEIDRSFVREALAQIDVLVQAFPMRPEPYA